MYDHQYTFFLKEVVVDSLQVEDGQDGLVRHCVGIMLWCRRRMWKVVIVTNPSCFNFFKQKKKKLLVLFWGGSFFVNGRSPVVFVIFKKGIIAN